MAKIVCIVPATAIDHQFNKERLEKAIKTINNSFTLKPLELEQISHEIRENRIPEKIIAESIIAVLVAAQDLADILEIKII